MQRAVETPAQVLRRWRRGQRLTKKAAASKLGVNEITYGRVEHGDVPNAGTLRKFTGETGISAELWLAYAESRKARLDRAAGKRSAIALFGALTIPAAEETSTGGVE